MATLMQTIVNIGKTIENESLRATILEEKIRSLSLEPVPLPTESESGEKVEHVDFQEYFRKKTHYSMLRKALMTRKVPSSSLPISSQSWESKSSLIKVLGHAGKDFPKSESISDRPSSEASPGFEKLRGADLGVSVQSDKLAIKTGPMIGGQTDLATHSTPKITEGKESAQFVQQKKMDSYKELSASITQQHLSLSQGSLPLQRITVVPSTSTQEPPAVLRPAAEPVIGVSQSAKFSLDLGSLHVCSPNVDAKFPPKTYPGESASVFLRSSQGESDSSEKALEPTKPAPGSKSLSRSESDST